MLGANIGTASWRTKPSWFVVAANNRMISPEQEKFSAKRMNAKTISLPTSHVPMLSKPKDVADFIADAALGKTSASAARNW